MAIEHHVTVTEQDDGTFDAACSCGWSDPGYDDHEDADFAADEHLKEV